MVHTLKRIALFLMLAASVSATELRNLYITDPETGDRVKINSEGQMHVVQETKVDTNNTTSVALGAGGVFTGTATDLSGYPGGINVIIDTDSASATKGLNIEYSADGSDWHIGEAYTIPAQANKFYSAPAWMTYYRLIYTNGPVAQTNFHIHAFVKKLTGKPSSHNSNESISDEDDGELVVAVIQARNDDGVWSPVKGSNDGNLLIHDAENPSAIAFGDVTGKSIVQKFGNMPDGDTSDGQITIWDGADDAGLNEHQYNYSTTADIDSIISSSASDTGAFEVQGLGSQTNLVIQTGILNGQTRVALATNLLRVFRIKNTSSSDWVGNISAYVTNAPTTGGVVDDSSLVRAWPINGNNQTEMAIYTVPSGKKLIIKGIEFRSAGAKKSAVYLCTVWARSPGGVFQLKWKGAFNDDLESGLDKPYQTGLFFDEGTDIELRVEILTAAVTEATISAGFEIEMKDKE